MRNRFRKFMIVCLAFVMILSLSACNKPDQTPSSPSSSSQAPSSPASSEESSSSTTSVEAASSQVSSSETSQSASSANEEQQKAMLQNMKKAAQEGKVLNIDFAVKTNLVDEVQEKWGKEDKSEYIAAAKGTYVTYAKHNAVFGFNKGSQLFEVRSTDSALKNITLSQTKAVFGKPDYDNKGSNEEIIGYVITKEFKILMVFPTAKSGEDPKLDHYSVFYPDGTVNSMADDPGRQW